MLSNLLLSEETLRVNLLELFMKFTTNDRVLAQSIIKNLKVLKNESLLKPKIMMIFLNIGSRGYLPKEEIEYLLISFTNGEIPKNHHVFSLICSMLVNSKQYDCEIAQKILLEQLVTEKQTLYPEIVLALQALQLKNWQFSNDTVNQLIDFSLKQPKFAELVSPLLQSMNLPVKLSNRLSLTINEGN